MTMLCPIFTTSQVEVCVAWVGPGGRTPVMLFSADIVQQLMGPLATPLSSQSSVVLSISTTLVIQPLFVWSHPQTPLSSLEEGLGMRLLFVVQSIFFFTQMCISSTSSVAPFPVQLSLHRGRRYIIYDDTSAIGSRDQFPIPGEEVYYLWLLLV